MSPDTPARDDPDRPSESPRFASGSLVAGRYEILERIGEGGAAEVFRARDQRLDRTVAIKILRPTLGSDPRSRARFATEARSAAALAAANIVPVYDFGATDDGSLFIVMRHVNGPSLRQVLAHRGALPSLQVADIGANVAGALAAAHEHGLVHRDVTPGNILIEADGRAQLTDFGIVKALGAEAELTRTGMVFGTAAYASPEQVTGGEVGPRSDIYALGAVLYEALAGRPPFAGADAMAVSYQHVHQPPPPLSSVAPDVDADLGRVVMRCLEKDPERRPQRAEEVATVLRAIAGRLAPRPEAATTMQAIVPGAATAAWPVVGAAPPRLGVQRGAVPGSRGSRRSGGARRRSGGLGAVAMMIALLAVVGAIALFSGVLGGADADLPPATSPPLALASTPPPTEAAILPPTPTASPSVPPTVPPPLVATPVPTAQPTLPPTLAPTPPPTPPPTAPPTPPPTAPPTEPPPTEPPPTEPPPTEPPPTEPPPTEPPPTEPPPAPAPVVYTERVPDAAFAGDYPGGTQYHGRSASWVYGQGTAYHTMTANFQLPAGGRAEGEARMVLVGLDAENPKKNEMAVVLNGATIYRGPNPLPNDTCCGSSGEGNWGSASFVIPADLLRRNNTLTISNLEPSDCTLCPRFVMIDFAELEYVAPP